MREIYSPSVTVGYDISLLSIVTFSNFKSRVEKYRNTPVAKGESIVIFLIESYMWFRLSYIVYWLSVKVICGLGYLTLFLGSLTSSLANGILGRIKHATERVKKDQNELSI
jgi:hypothetical protein